VHSLSVRYTGIHWLRGIVTLQQGVEVSAVVAGHVVRFDVGKVGFAGGKQAQWVRVGESMLEVAVGNVLYVVKKEEGGHGEDEEDEEREKKQIEHLERNTKYVSDKYMKIMKLMNFTMDVIEDEEKVDEDSQVDIFRNMNDLYSLISDEIN